MKFIGCTKSDMLERAKVPEEVMIDSLANKSANMYIGIETYFVSANRIVHLDSTTAFLYQVLSK